MSSMAQKSIVVVLTLITVISSIGLVWKSQDLLERHQTYMLREGIWPVMEMERTLLNLKEVLVRISLGSTVSLEEYSFKLKLTTNRVEVIYRFTQDNSTLSTYEVALVERVRNDLQTYYSMENGEVPDREISKRLILILESAISSSHDLLNSRRDITYTSNVETFSYIGYLLSWLSVTLFMLILASTTIYFSNQQRLRHEIKIAQLQRQAAEQEKEVAISRARVTMASELHDVLNYHLAIIAQKLSRAHDQLTANSAVTRKEILEARARTMLALRDARGSIHALRSGNIQPLDQAIQALDVGGMALHVEVLGQARELPDDLAFAAYRIMQEAVANTIKHAHQATSINVTLDFQRAAFGLTITDDGKALPSDGQDERTTTSLGLIGVQERVEQLWGSFHHTNTGQGYYIQASFPTEPISNDSDSRPGCGRSSNFSTYDPRQS